MDDPTCISHGSCFAAVPRPRRGQKERGGICRKLPHQDIMQRPMRVDSLANIASSVPRHEIEQHAAPGLG